MHERNQLLAQKKITIGFQTAQPKKKTLRVGYYAFDTKEMPE
jgi:hypothetical protein